MESTDTDKLYTYKPIRFVPSGDKTAAKKYLRDGQRMSAALDKDMSFQGLDQGKATRDTEDYTITVTHTFRERKIEVYHKPQPGIEPPVEPEVPKSCECAVNFADCEIVGITLDSEDNLPQFGNHNEYCVCYDVLVCGPNHDDADENGFVLWERVRPSDFTRYQTGDKAIVVFEEMEIVHDPDDYTIVLSSSCDGCTIQEMDPDHEDYIHPVIIPFVMYDDDLLENSYTSFFDRGLMSSVNEVEAGEPSFSPYTQNEDTGYRTFAIGTKKNSQDSTSGTLSYPTVKSTEISGISCSVHTTDTADLDDKIAWYGDIIASRSFGPTRIENTPRIFYRDRWYNDEDEIPNQVAGGSFAFDDPSMEGGNEFAGVAYQGLIVVPFDMDSPSMVVGCYHGSLGKMPDGTVHGETKGRLVLRPATKWLFYKGEYENDYGQGAAYLNFIDIRTNDWPVDLWKESDGGFVQIEEPVGSAWLNGPVDADLVLFRQMFTTPEKSAWGGCKPWTIRPEAIDELSSSFGSIKHSEIDIDPDDCPGTGTYVVSPILAPVTTRWKSEDFDWFVFNANSEDLIEYELYDATLGVDNLRTLGQLHNFSSYGGACDCSYDFPIYLAYATSLYNYVHTGWVIPPPTGVLEISLCYEVTDTSDDSTEAVTRISTSGSDGDEISGITSFLVGETSNPLNDDEYCEASNGLLQYANYNYDEPNLRERYTQAGGSRKRYFIHSDNSVESDVGTQIDEGDFTGEENSPNASTANWAFVSKSNLVISVNKYFTKTHDGTSISSVYGSKRITGCYYPLSISEADTTASRYYDLDKPVHMSTSDQGLRQFSHSLDFQNYLSGDYYSQEYSLYQAFLK